MGTVIYLKVGQKFYTPIGNELKYVPLLHINSLQSTIQIAA